MDLTKALPNTVTCHGRAFSVYTDYRIWMRFEIQILNWHEGDDFPIDYLFKNEVPFNPDIADLLAFSRPYSELPRRMQDEDVTVIDWEIDGELIYAAILGQYGIDLFEVKDLHWHKFLAMIKGLNEQTRMREVMQYRAYKKETGKNIDQYERLRDAWEIRRLTSEEEREIAEFSKVFGGE